MSWRSLVIGRSINYNTKRLGDFRSIIYCRGAGKVTGIYPKEDDEDWVEITLMKPESVSGRKIAMPYSRMVIACGLGTFVEWDGREYLVNTRDLIDCDDIFGDDHDCDKCPNPCTEITKCYETIGSCICPLECDSFRRANFITVEEMWEGEGDAEPCQYLDNNLICLIGRNPSSACYTTHRCEGVESND